MTTTADPARPRRRINDKALMVKVAEATRFKPHPGQAQILNSDARHQVASCGRRFGKSYVGGNRLAVEGVKTRILLPQLEDAGRRREFWIVGPNYTDSEKEFRVLYNALSKLGAPFDRPGTYNDPHAGNMQLSLYGGKFLVIAKSAAKPESLVGEGLNGVIMAEAAKQKETTWTKFIRPMLSDYNGWSLHTSTPEGKNWFYENWMKGQSAHESDWESWRMPAWRNPFVYPMGATKEAIQAIHNMQSMKVPITDEVIAHLGIDPEIGSLLRDLTKETFNQEIGADFTEFVGRVFKDFDEEIHVKDLTYNPGLQTFAALDYGFTNPFVWLLIQMDDMGTVYVLDEFYETGLTIDEAIREVAARDLCPSQLRSFYPDPASPGDTRAIQKALHINPVRGTGGELNTRLRMIRAALKERNVQLPVGHPDRKPKLLIDRKCTNMIREMNDYRYPKTSAEAAEMKTNIPELPMKKDDHCPEALGRFFAGMFNTPERRGTRQRSASFG